ncbi:MAG: MraY family glycosyltransferase [Fibrobacteria bacterium]
METDIGRGAVPYLAYSAAVLLAAGTVVATTPLAISLARRFGIVDKPNRRKVHVGQIPRMGGLAVFLGILVPFLLLRFASDSARELIQSNLKAFLCLAGGGVLLFLVGLWDDLRGASPRLKFAFQVAAGLIAFYGGFRFQLHLGGHPLSNYPAIGTLCSLILTILWIVGTTNAVNLIDGLDGLASGISGIALLLLGFISVYNHHAAIALGAFIAGGSAFGFLAYNRHPAKIFLGDSGSLLLGFMLAVLAIQGSQQGSLVASLIGPVCLLFVPLFDVALAMVRRAQQGMPFSAADRQHIHHRLLGRGISHPRVVIILWTLTLGVGGMALLMHFLKDAHRSGLVNILAVVLLGLAIRYLGTLEMSATMRSVRNINRRKRTPREKILWLRRSLAELDKCETAQAAFQQLARIGTGMEIESLAVSMACEGGAAEALETYRWDRSPRAGGTSDWTWEESNQDIVVVAKEYLIQPEVRINLEIRRHGWKARRASEDAQLWANLIVDALAKLRALVIFSPAESFAYSTILEET